MTDADAGPIAGGAVDAVDVDLRRREELRRTTTDRAASTEVRYAASRSLTRRHPGCPGARRGRLTYQVSAVRIWPGVLMGSFVVGGALGAVRAATV